MLNALAPCADLIFSHFISMIPENATSCFVSFWCSFTNRQHSRYLGTRPSNELAATDRQQPCEVSSLLVFARHFIGTQHSRLATRLMCTTDQNTIRPGHRLHATKAKVLDNNSCLSVAFVEICVTRHWLQAAYSTAQTVARGDTAAGVGACVPSPAEMVSTCQHRLFIAGLCSEVALQEYIIPTDRN